MKGLYLPGSSKLNKYVRNIHMECLTGLTVILTEASKQMSTRASNLPGLLKIMIIEGYYLHGLSQGMSIEG